MLVREYSDGPEFLHEALDFVAKSKVKSSQKLTSSTKLPKLISALLRAKPASERFSRCKSRVRANGGPE
jgi:hypothetical protein